MRAARLISARCLVQIDVRACDHYATGSTEQTAHLLIQLICRAAQAARKKVPDETE